MAVIGVYDFDFFHYENVIPNLECAKLVTYLRNHNDIAILSPKINPGMYTRFIIRKEYNDGFYPKEMFVENCEYGGRAFTPEQYKPLAPGIEKTIPDMHIYDKYISYFGNKPAQEQLKRILNCAHMRLAPDSHNLLTFEQLKPNFENKVTGIFLHDYDLASLNACDLILELQNQRRFKTKFGINPYPVGNKYPIRIYNSDDLARWMKIVTIPNAFFLEYYGLMSDEVIYNLCNDNRRMARQIYYNISNGCTSENEFFIQRLPKIFVQTLFLRKAGIKILLNYSDGFFVTPELEKFIQLLNCWLSFKWQEGFMPLKQTLYAFCKDSNKLKYTNWAYRTITLSLQEMRDVFQYIRETNYELFKMFYEWDSVVFEGGKFKNEWTRN